MPKRTRQTVPSLMPAQANYVLRVLVDQKKISYNDIVSAKAQMNREIQELEATLRELKGIAGNGGRRRTRTQPTGAAAARKSRRKKAATPEQKKARRIQGQYLGLLIRLPKNKRAPFQKIAREKGAEAAIAELRKAAGQ